MSDMTWRGAPIADRFWAKVDKTGDCWEWKAGKKPNGYGQFKLSKPVQKQASAHRVAYELTYGAIPDGMQIDHVCHNVGCVRPEHLRAVTVKQNIENRPHAMRNSKSGIRGVSKHHKYDTWTAKVGHNYKIIHVGSYRSPEEAEEAARAKRLELHTHNDADRINS